MARTIIYAPNVSGGGGLLLLQAILNAFPEGRSLFAILDGRAKFASALPAEDIFWAKSSLKGRWQAEKLLAATATADDIILCFHNLPPVLPVAGRIFCYVQNANLVGLIPTSHLSGWVAARYFVERFIARRYAHRIDQYLVQTPTMANALRKWLVETAKLGKPPPVHVVPFTEELVLPSSGGDPSAARWDFLYVSDGPAHKNHLRLFDAWVLLAKEGLYPSLALTLRSDRDRALCQTLAALKSEHGLAITDLGQLPHREILACYAQAKALLFASYAESYGIPFLEAKAAGLPILAAELDFVRDMCAPVETFDPFSAVSIARAVKRFLYDRHDMVTPLSPRAFVDRLIADDWGTGDSASAVDTDPAPLPSMPENKHGNRDRNRAKAAHDKP